MDSLDYDIFDCIAKFLDFPSFVPMTRTCKRLSTLKCDMERKIECLEEQRVLKRKKGLFFF